MLRGFILGLALIVSSSPAVAQTARARLPAVNDVAFGSTFAAAQAKLGPDFEAGTAPGNDNIKTLIGGHVPLYGVAYLLNYRFGGSDGELTAVYAMNLDSHDFAICRANYSTSLTGLITQFGEPNEKTEDYGTETQVASATFTFDDGSAIEPLLLGCIVMISYERTPKKK